MASAEEPQAQQRIVALEQQVAELKLQLEQHARRGQGALQSYHAWKKQFGGLAMQHGKEEKDEEEEEEGGDDCDDRHAHAAEQQQVANTAALHGAHVQQEHAALHGSGCASPDPPLRQPQHRSPAPAASMHARAHSHSGQGGTMLLHTTADATAPPLQGRRAPAAAVAPPGHSRSISLPHAVAHAPSASAGSMLELVQQHMHLELLRGFGPWQEEEGGVGFSGSGSKGARPAAGQSSSLKEDEVERKQRLAPVACRLDAAFSDPPVMQAAVRSRPSFGGRGGTAGGPAPTLNRRYSSSDATVGSGSSSGGLTGSRSSGGRGEGGAALGARLHGGSADGQPLRGTAPVPPLVCLPTEPVVRSMPSAVHGRNPPFSLPAPPASHSRQPSAQHELAPVGDHQPEQQQPLLLSSTSWVATLPAHLQQEIEGRQLLLTSSLPSPAEASGMPSPLPAPSDYLGTSSSEEEEDEDEEGGAGGPGRARRARGGRGGAGRAVGRGASGGSSGSGGSSTTTTTSNSSSSFSSSSTTIISHPTPAAVARSASAARQAGDRSSSRGNGVHEGVETGVTVAPWQEGHIWAARSRGEGTIGGQGGSNADVRLLAQQSPRDAQAAGAAAVHQGGLGAYGAFAAQGPMSTVAAPATLLGRPGNINPAPAVPASQQEGSGSLVSVASAPLTRNCSVGHAAAALMRPEQQPPAPGTLHQQQQEQQQQQQRSHVRHVRAQSCSQALSLAAAAAALSGQPQAKGQSAARLPLQPAAMQVHAVLEDVVNDVVYLAAFRGGDAGEVSRVPGKGGHGGGSGAAVSPWGLVDGYRERLREQGEEVQRLRAALEQKIKEVGEVRAAAGDEARRLGEALAEREGELQRQAAALRQKDEDAAHLCMLLQASRELVGQLDARLQAQDEALQGALALAEQRGEEAQRARALVQQQGEAVEQLQRLRAEGDREKQRLGALLEQRGEEVGQLRALLQRQGEKVERLQRLRKEGEAEAERLRLLLGRQGQELGQARQAAGELGAEVERLRGEARAGEEGRELRAALAAQGEKTATLRAQLEQQAGELLLLREHARCKDDELQQRTAEADALAAQLQQRTAEADALAAQLQQRTAEADALAAQLQQRTAEAETLATQLQQLQQQQHSGAGGNAAALQSPRALLLPPREREGGGPQLGLEPAPYVQEAAAQAALSTQIQVLQQEVHSLTWRLHMQEQRCAELGGQLQAQRQTNREQQSCIRDLSARLSDRSAAGGSNDGPLALPAQVQAAASPAATGGSGGLEIASYTGGVWPLQHRALGRKAGSAGGAGAASEHEDFLPPPILQQSPFFPRQHSAAPAAPALAAHARASPLDALAALGPRTLASSLLAAPGQGLGGAGPSWLAPPQFHTPSTLRTAGSYLRNSLQRSREWP